MPGKWEQGPALTRGGTGTRPCTDSEARVLKEGEWLGLELGTCTEGARPPVNRMTERHE